MPNEENDATIERQSTAIEAVVEGTGKNGPECSKIIVDSIECLELPTFWTKKAQLWFVSIEALFASKRITNDSTKYFAVVSRLDQDTLSVIEHIVTDPPLSNKYQTIKDALINHFSISQERQFKTLISGLELGGKRPSMLLTEIQRLGGKLEPKFIRAMWIDRLPQYVQVALATADTLTNEKLAQLADKIMDIQTGQQQICPVSQHIPNTDTQLQVVAQQLAKLCNKIDKLLPQKEFQPRSRSGSPFRKSTNTNLCYYHKRFGANATKCREPCKWQKPADESGN